MKGKTVVITGATSGIGKIAAARLASMGARLVLVARDKARGEATLAHLRNLNPDVDHKLYFADLSRLSEMKQIASTIASAESRIDVLINNAGALFANRHVTEDDMEMTFALNHMSYFVLTHGLGELLIASAPSRVVNTSSDAHKGKQIDFNDLQSTNYKGFKVYGCTKLCNILYTRELAYRLTGTGVTANCLHPGFVDTRFGDESGGLLSFGVRVAKIFAISPEKGAETIVYLASSDDVATDSGGYYYKCKKTAPSNEAQDDHAAKHLWQESERLAGIKS